MFKAKDEHENIVFAENATKEGKYFCPGCNGELILRHGEQKAIHFAHKSKCPFPPEEKEYLSEWHIRMQSYFPPESREYYFDEEGEKHRADVFLEDKNTVIEFQKSPITREEYERRTFFHLNAGRRIIWVFDESTDKPKPGDKGKLRKVEYSPFAFPHDHLTYQWLRYRKCLSIESTLPPVNSSNYAVYLYTGADNGDYLHRIVDVDPEDGFQRIAISIAHITLEHGMNVDYFFADEEWWIDQSPYARTIYISRLHKAVEQERQKAEKEEREKRRAKEIKDAIFGKRTRRWTL